MSRLLNAMLPALATLLLICACDTGTGYDGYRPYGGAGPCKTFTSCGTCTPISGCGWCFTGAGNSDGVCTDEPNDCPTLQFSWTWDPNGCRVSADAGIGSDAADAGVLPAVDASTEAE
jgi:hypothetical protein